MFSKKYVIDILPELNCGLDKILRYPNFNLIKYEYQGQLRVHDARNKTNLSQILVICISPKQKSVNFKHLSLKLYILLYIYIFIYTINDNYYLHTFKECICLMYKCFD